MITYNLPDESVATGYVCPVGYDKTDNACIDGSDNVIRFDYACGYEFEYYENAGELVGRYALNSEQLDRGSHTSIGARERQDHASPYFGQNARVGIFSNFLMSAPKQFLQSTESVLFIKVDHSRTAGVTSIKFHHDFVDVDEAIANPEDDPVPDSISSFYLGEFHLITNTMKSFRRVNANYQLLQGNYLEEAAYANYLNVSPQPSMNEHDGEDAFVEMYLGWTKVSLKDRPATLDREDYPSILNPINATDWLEWKTLNNSCSTWRRVYNGTIPNTYFESINATDGHYICQTKYVINRDKLKAYLDANFNSAAYPITTGSTRARTYTIVIYPPSYYFYKAKNPSSFVRPIPNFVNREMDDIIFKTPKNYKSDGNFHYKIEFYNSKVASDLATPIFVTSSFEDDPSYEEKYWEYSTTTLDTFNQITKAQPLFDNQYYTDKGSDGNLAKYIKYTLSEACRMALEGRSDIIFRIKQLDGTLIETPLEE